MDLFSEYKHREHFVLRGLHITVIQARGKNCSIYIYIYICIYMYARVVNNLET